MKIHPHHLLLREIVETLSSEHMGLFRHLLSCQQCRERTLPLVRRQTSALARRVADVLHWNDEPHDYSQALAPCALSHEDQWISFGRERAAARRLRGELKCQPFERQVLIVENSPRFHTWGLLELLIEDAREAVPSDLAGSEELLALALRVADKLNPSLYGLERIEDLKARAWAWIGNCRRVRSDLAGAEKAFTTASIHLKGGTGDLVERAIVLDLRASLLRAQRRFEQAARLLARAFSVFLEYGDPHRAGRTLIKMDDILHQLGTPEKGIPILYRAIELIDPNEEPFLVLCIWHNLIDDLAEAGRFLEAHGLFARAQAIYRRFPDAPTQNRRRWVQGKISRGLGQCAEAEAHFTAARDGFLAAEFSYDTALVSLDLASLYAEQGRTAELKALAEAIVPIFSAQGIHREALAALLLLQKAIAAETASLDLLSRIAAYLKRAQHDPELRFETP
jgi:tetratricopeptide (TPR) repeat protein